MKLSIIRHADPDYKNNTITAAGHLEAQALARKLKNEKCDRIYSSPINRAVHTMQYTADLLGIEPQIEPWTKELGCSVKDENGASMAAWNIAGEKVREPYPAASQETYLSRPPYEEFVPIFDQLKKDSDAFLQKHGYIRDGGRYKRINPSDEHILLFCHLGFGLVLLSHLLELPIPLVWSGFWLPPSSVTTIIFEQHSDDWAVPRCIGLADVSHLHLAGLNVSPAGLHRNANHSWW